MSRKTAAEHWATWWPVLVGLAGVAAIVVQNQMGLQQLDTNMIAGLGRLDENLIVLRKEVREDVKDLVEAMGDRFKAADHEVHMTEEYRPLRSEVSDLRDRVTRLEPRGGGGGG